MSDGLRFANISRSFGKVSALEALDLSCPAGSMTCLIGPNGAGKSTALALAAGLLAPSSGSVLAFGREISPASPPDSLGYLPQNSAFHPLLSVGEVLELAFALRGADGEERDQALQVSGLGAMLDRPVGQLSGGSLRRLGLVSALLGSPRLLLLDEPFAGLDPQTLDRLLAHLEMRLESGTAIVVASHDFEVLDPFGARIAVLDEGRLKLCVAAPLDGSTRSTYRQALAPAAGASCEESV